MTNGYEFDQSATYQICLKGVLDSSWSDWFGSFRITIQGDKTFLIGNVTDQAALHGILAKINELGLTLISVNKLTNNDQHSSQAHGDKGNPEGTNADQPSAE